MGAAHDAGDQIVDEELAGPTVLLQPVQLVGPEPAVLGVLGPLQGGVGQIAVDLDDPVGLVPSATTVVTGPGGDTEERAHPS
ncbi:hypothetical protein ACIPWY_19375 [Streptomyces sp. NPDC090032]|uniref:hypothetical protein n=1 Tax=unclassified Streptomyces TaxID=2593676 RepID=UPI0037221462